MTGKVRRKMSLNSRRELLAATAERYQQATKKEKESILDEFVATTAYHRKYANRLLLRFKGYEQPRPKIKRKRARIYDRTV